MERAKPKAKNGRDTAFGSRTGILRSPASAAFGTLARSVTLKTYPRQQMLSGGDRQMQNSRLRPEGCIPTVLRLRLRTLAYSEGLAKENAPVGRFLEAVSPQEPV